MLRAKTKRSHRFEPLQAGAAARGFRLSSVNLDSLCVAMRSANGGVQIQDRMHRLQRYKNCFVGREAIDWMCAEMGISRAQALQLGQRLSSLGMIKHVHDEHDFEDAYLFYVFVHGERGSEAGSAEDAILADFDLTRLATDLRSNDGVRAGTRHYRLVRYPDCFFGTELVDWICARHRLTRPTAVKLGKLLLRRNVIRHVFDEHDFDDAPLLYRFMQ